MGLTTHVRSSLLGKAFDGDGNVGSVDAVLPSRNKLTKETIDQQARRAYIAAKEAESRRVFEDVANPFEGKAKLNRTKEMKFERAPVVSDPLAADAITLYSSETIFQKADRPSFGRKKLRFEPEDAPLK